MILFKNRREELPDYVKDYMDNANVYYSSGYEKMETEAGNIPVYFYDNSFILVVFIKKKMIFRYAHMPTEYIEMNFEKKPIYFLDEVAKVLKQKFNVHWMGPTDNQAIFKEKPSNCKAIPFGSHIIDLSLSEEILFSNLHSKHRNVIRRAVKEGLRIEKGQSEEMYQVFLELDKITWKRSNQISYTRNLTDSMRKNALENTIIYLIYKNDEPQGGAFFFYNNSMCYYTFGASVDKPSTGAMNLLHWKAILDMKEKGVKRYSFVGCRINEDPNSKSHTMQRFKERFGGVLEIGYMFKVILNPKMYRLYSWLNYMKKNKGKKMPMDIVDQELSKWN